MAERVFERVGKRCVRCSLPCPAKELYEGTSNVSLVHPVHGVKDEADPRNLLPVCSAHNAPIQDLSGDNLPLGDILSAFSKGNVGQAESPQRVCVIYTEKMGIIPVEE